MLSEKEAQAVRQFVHRIRSGSVGSSVKDVKLFGSKTKGTKRYKMPKPS